VRGKGVKRSTGSNARIAGGTGLISHKMPVWSVAEGVCAVAEWGLREEKEKRRGGPVDALDPSVV
jgi:hypothetical protein